MKSCRIIASGIVQGVFYRAFVKEQADALGLKGFARNLADGRVEAILQGRIQDIDKMILLCRKGPFLAEVRDIKIVELPDQQFHSFEIVK